MKKSNSTGLGWLGIIRLGLVQTALGSIVVLTTATINRVMVVELALPAVLPGLLVGLHYGVQLSRPRFGHGSDLGGRRTPWIIGLGNDELGYIIPEYDFILDDLIPYFQEAEGDHYEETNSVGPHMAGVVDAQADALIDFAEWLAG